MKWPLAIFGILFLLVGSVSAGALQANATSFYYNNTIGAGTQTSYQMKFILSNSSGVSGYYAPDTGGNNGNIIYTNGTTRADWADINATDGSDAPLPFWIENNTQTTKNATAWVNVASIATGNTSTGKWYFGNASQTVNTMNGYNTFPLFDDFNSAALNTTQWVNNNGATVSVANGNMTNTGATSYTQTITSATSFGYNYSVIMRSKYSVGAAGNEAYGFSNAFSASPGPGILALNVNGYRFSTYQTGYNADGNNGDTNINRDEMIRNTSSGYVDFYRNGVKDFLSTSQVPTATLPVAFRAYVAGYTITTDWIFVRKFVYPEPKTSLYSTSATTVITPISASFTQSANPSSTGQLVTYTDTSPGPPVTWNWTLAGTTPTNTTQNAAYTYTTAGTYNIFLNVTNATGLWSNTSQTHTVNNASGFTPQDVWMQGQYIQTFHILDSNALPIAVVTITDSGGQTFTTTNGTGYLTEPFGVSVVTFVASGYNAKAVSYVFDSDGSWTVQLVTASATPSSNTNLIYTPWQVRIDIMDYYSNPLPGTNVTAYYVASTLPSTNTTWLVSAFGIAPSVAADMTNSGLALAGTTDANGGLSFTMFKSIEYNLSIVNATSGVSASKLLYPSDTEYKIRVPTTGQAPVNNTLAQMNGTGLPVYLINSSCYNLSVKYTDQSGLTTDVRFQVKYRQNGTWLLDRDEGAPGLGMLVDNFTVCKYGGFNTGDEVIWAFNATRSGT